MRTTVLVRPCIYEDGHIGPHVGPDGEWWQEQVSEADGFCYVHLPASHA